MKTPPTHPGSPPPQSAPQERLRSALLAIEQAKCTLQELARELPNPPTVELVVRGQRKRELASAAGAEPTVAEQQLGAAERSIERLDAVTDDLRDLAWSGPMPEPVTWG